MSIHFPNASRSYDASRRTIRFWGHDSAMERSFSITAYALRQLQPNVEMEEAALLNAFDVHRDRICQRSQPRCTGAGRAASPRSGKTTSEFPPTHPLTAFTL